MDKTGSQYVSLGVGFAQVSDTATFKLGDIVPSKWDWYSDKLQVLDTAAAKVVATYDYYGVWDGAIAGDDEGWYDITGGGESPADDVEFPVGTAFLGNFAAKQVCLSQSGAVLSGSTLLDYTGSQYVMFGNPLPVGLTLGDIVPTKWDWYSDKLQVLNTGAAKVVATYDYYGTWDGAIAGDDEGWYDITGGGEEPADDVVVNPGDAWLGNFAAKDVVIVFPAAVE